MSILSILKNDGVAVLATDTLYGLIGSAFSERAVEKIFALKGRDETKALIILISSLSDLLKFGVKITSDQEAFLNNVWPGKISVILPCPGEQFSYIHCGLQSIAFRMIGPANPELYSLIQEVGPLVAPSANPQGEEPAKSITQAQAYFGDGVDLYIDSGEVVSEPSTIVSFVEGKLVILRQGVVYIPEH